VAVDTDDDDGDGDGDVLAHIVPVGFATRRDRRDPQPLSAFTFRRLMGRRVRLRVNGFDVEGRFDGADEDDVYLRGELRFDDVWRLRSLRHARHPIPGRLIQARQAVAILAGGAGGAVPLGAACTLPVPCLYPACTLRGLA
jgi:hypothetical protein